MDNQRAEIITSFKNPKIQFIRELLTSRKSREGNGAFVVEGVRLAEEAARAGNMPLMVVFNETLSKRGRELLNGFKDPSVQLINVPDELMAKISDTESDQGLLLVIKHKHASLPENPNFVVILDGIKDPGNMGTILRTAAAAGVQLVIHTPGCVDVYSPKVVRSAMGAHFNIPMTSMNWEAIKTFWKNQPLYLAESSHGKPIWELDFTKAVGIIIGGEAEGASAEARQAASNFAIIPMPGKSESLNAAIAAGIFIFEVVRQRNK